MAGDLRLLVSTYTVKETFFMGVQFIQKAKEHLCYVNRRFCATKNRVDSQIEPNVLCLWVK